MATFTDTIRFAHARFLVRLLELRPDLASPSPGTLFSLGARATNVFSMSKAMASLNAIQLQVLEAVVTLTSLKDEVTANTVVSAIIGPDPDVQVVNCDYTAAAQAITQALEYLLELALVWCPTPGNHRSAPGIEEALDRFPAGFGPLTKSTPIVPLPATAPAAAHSVLSTMLWGPPVGIVPSNLNDQPEHHHESATLGALRWLLKHNYLELIDPTHISLPRQVAFALRGERTHRKLLTPPVFTANGPEIADAQIQTESTNAATEMVRRMTELISLWESEPCPALRSGGLPVREVRNLSNKLDLTSEQVHVVTEAAFAARLVRTSDSTPEVYAPTVQVDHWLNQDLPTRWQHLVFAWLNSPRTTWLIGQLDDRAQTISALSPPNHQPWVVRMRATILKTLAQHPGQALSPPDMVQLLQWKTPRTEVPLDAVTGILAEAKAYGVTGAGALLPGLLQPGGDKPGWVCEPAQALTASLPEPVREIFIQGDLTAMVPGRPTDALDTLLSECAEVESRGGALTVRFTPASITRAFDSGRTAAGLLQELQMYSVTPIPQPLDYLISDSARKHGRVRVGSVSTYIRIADPVVMASILNSPACASIGVFELGPNVLGAHADLAQVLGVLRDAKLAPAVEDHQGNIVTADRLRPRTRLPAGPVRPEATGGLPSHPVGPATVFADARLHPQTDLGPLVEQLIAATQTTQPMATSPAGTPAVTESVLAQTTPAAPTGQTITLLREAMSAGQELWLELVDSAGRTTRRKLKPLSIESGRLRAADLNRESELTVSVHRIATAQPVEKED